MSNRITWETIDSESFLDVDVKVNLSLEVSNFIRLQLLLKDFYAFWPFLFFSIDEALRDIWF